MPALSIEEAKEQISILNNRIEKLENYAKNNCKYSTFRKYRSVLKYHILPFFRDKMLNDITCNDIQEFYYFCTRFYEFDDFN